MERNGTPTNTGGEHAGGDVVPKASILEWLAEKDSALSGALADLEAAQPNLFSTPQQIMEQVIRAARLSERQDILAEIAEALSERPDGD